MRFDVLPGKQDFRPNKVMKPSSDVKTAPEQEKEVENAMGLTPSDPEMDFDGIGGAKTYRNFEFENIKDLNSAPGSTTNTYDDPKIKLYFWSN